MISTTAVDMKKGRDARGRRTIRAWAVAFWLAVWQAVSMALDQQILLVSPVRVLVRLAGLAVTAEFWGAVLFTLLPAPALCWPDWHRASAALKSCWRRPC